MCNNCEFVIWSEHDCDSAFVISSRSHRHAVDNTQKAGLNAQLTTTLNRFLLTQTHESILVTVTMSRCQDRTNTNKLGNSMLNSMMQLKHHRREPSRERWRSSCRRLSSVLRRCSRSRSRSWRERSDLLSSSRRAAVELLS